MGKHTPGPWEDDKTTGPEPRITGGPLRLIKSGGFVIAFVPMWLDDEHIEARANARLIAAAPELLALLKDWREACGAMIHDELAALTDAVIAKATGGTTK